MILELLATFAIQPDATSFDLHRTTEGYAIEVHNERTYKEGTEPVFITGDGLTFTIEIESRKRNLPDTFTVICPPGWYAVPSSETVREFGSFTFFVFPLEMF